MGLNLSDNTSQVESNAETLARTQTGQMTAVGSPAALCTGISSGTHQPHANENEHFPKQTKKEIQKELGT